MYRLISRNSNWPGMTWPNATEYASELRLATTTWTNRVMATTFWVSSLQDSCGPRRNLNPAHNSVALAGHLGDRIPNQFIALGCVVEHRVRNRGPYGEGKVSSAIFK